MGRGRYFSLCSIIISVIKDNNLHPNISQQQNLLSNKLKFSSFSLFLLVFWFLTFSFLLVLFSMVGFIFCFLSFFLGGGGGGREFVVLFCFLNLSCIQTYDFFFLIHLQYFYNNQHDKTSRRRLLDFFSISCNTLCLTNSKIVSSFLFS